jgi:PAS domain S-box-containing protein
MKHAFSSWLLLGLFLSVGTGAPFPSRAADPAPAPEANEEAKQILFDPNAQLAVIVSDEGIFQEVSAGWEELLGWTPSEMVGRSWQEFVHPDDLEASIESAKRPTGEGVINRYRTRWDRYVTLRWYGAHWRSQPWSYSVAVPLDYSGERNTLPMWSLTPPPKP